ncbi:hypothetical protein LguiA_004634 [Lonicera macranthoides]
MNDVYECFKSVVAMTVPAFFLKWKRSLRSSRFKFWTAAYRNALVMCNASMQAWWQGNVVLCD